MRNIKVNAGGGYEILIQKGILSFCSGYIKKICAAKKICIVSDTNVYPLYGESVKTQLENEGYSVIDYVFPAGEESKNTSTVIKIVEFLAENALTRNDLVVALGGGVTGDMAGFASAIYLRGIDFVQLPTSLLAQVDSSVGGKTAVDLPQGKNLCGAFHQPALVLIDPDTLDTLPERYYCDGMAEAIKMGCIKSRELFEIIENQDGKNDIEEIICRCVSLKAEVVERDEKEHGERALLNFGHTAGHAIEKLHGFKDISHGEAVGIGMVLICQAGEKNGLTETGCAERIKSVLSRYSLPLSDNSKLGDIVKAMNADKKRTGSSIKFVFIKNIGDGYIYPVENEKIPALFGV